MKRKVPRTALIVTLLAVSSSLKTNLSMSSDEPGPTTMRVSSRNLICASPAMSVLTRSPM
jgi:hypothetical protein